MKMLRKYATIASLLVAMTTVVPMHGSLNSSDQAKAEVLIESETPWDKTPKGLKDWARAIVVIATWVSFPFVFHAYVDAKMGLEGKPKNETSLLDEIKKWSQEATATEKVGVGFASLSAIALLFSLPVITAKKSEIPWYKNPEVLKNFKDFAFIAAVVTGWMYSPCIFYACKDQISQRLKI